MKLFTVKLSDEERARLEEHRVLLGLRAHTDVIRHWIAERPNDEGLYEAAAEAGFGRRDVNAAKVEARISGKPVVEILGIEKTDAERAMPEEGTAEFLAATSSLTFAEAVEQLRKARRRAGNDQ